ncbi:hypothetical protein PPYR_12339 [Photinus pyralis]|uniref:Sodium/calcium exchanger membrane region domain-containing protein n=1 Tax=Photinus pyralis TaxID=7054 RepID=A0A5N4ADU5_PHOPY|nr:sodium/potassium/calcium exchanger 3-like isoform X1 [Photinus pyralis]KAB0795500.1 hypothetical protein PPYR_12339 [Photinus pyralis]
MLLKIITFCLIVTVCAENSTKSHQNATEDALLANNEIHYDRNCTPAAIHEFPSDGLTREQRRSGWVAVHVFLTIYSFIILSTVCDAYFVPAIQVIAKRFNLAEDVVGASFMAVTNSSPEIFINFVGTFVTEGDIGIGTVLGSNVFNILAVPVCCGFFTKTAFYFDWWLIIRDGMIYAVSVILLIVTLSDDKVYWYEALAFVLLYSVYMLALYFNTFMKKTVNRFCMPRDAESAAHELGKLNEKAQQNHVDNNVEQPKPAPDVEKAAPPPVDDDSDFEYVWNVWTFPKDSSMFNKVWWIFVWPILFILKYTIPNTKKHHSMFLLTLLMCIAWIGSMTYLLSWFITAIGDTISIPDSVMGLIFLAIGSSIPEIVSCIIVSKQGQGIMGMSSALGANNFEVLLCLGLPWLVKTLFYPKTDGSHWININSSGLAYNAACLLSTLILLYITIICNKFRLNWKTGVICLTLYVVFLVIGTLIELNVFFVVNLPTCT